MKHKCMYLSHCWCVTQVRSCPIANTNHAELFHGSSSADLIALALENWYVTICWHLMLLTSFSSRNPNQVPAIKLLPWVQAGLEAEHFDWFILFQFYVLVLLLSLELVMHYTGCMLHFQLGACYALYGVHVKVKDDVAELYLHQNHKKLAEPLSKPETDIIISRIVSKLSSLTAAKNNSGKAKIIY